MKFARRHHTVPRFYLDGFANRLRKNRLLVFDAVTRKQFSAQASDLTTERDFNRLDIDGIEPDALENSYSQLESEFAIALSNTLRAKRFATDDDRIWIANFVALLILRNPRVRGQMASAFEEINKKVLSLLVADKKRWVQQTQKMLAEGYLKEGARIDFEQFKDFVHRDEFDIRFPREFFIKQEVMLLEKLPQIVASRNWIILLAPTGSGGFVTSDHPATLMWSDPKLADGLFGPGLGLKSTSLICPLSREVAIVGEFEAVEGTFEIELEQVAALNGATISGAQRQVYCHGPDAMYLMEPGERPRSCLTMIGDHRFRASAKPKRPWY